MAPIRDIVCGCELSPPFSFTVKHGDRPFYFCGEKCKNDFVRNPLKYVEKTGAVSSTEGSPKLNAEGEHVHSRS